MKILFPIYIGVSGPVESYSCWLEADKSKIINPTNKVDTLGERRHVWLQLWKISQFLSPICGQDRHGKRTVLRDFVSLAHSVSWPPPLCCTNIPPYTIIEIPDFFPNHSPSFKGHSSETTHRRKKVQYNLNTKDLCLHFKVGIVFLGERMPEQEMFEKRYRFATFLTSSHSFLIGNLSQFFATYVEDLIFR